MTREDPRGPEIYPEDECAIQVVWPAREDRRWVGTPEFMAREQLEHVQVYKNGGVGALNDMGTQEAAVHAERWCWLVVTRKKGARYLVITPRGRPGAGWWSRARRARRAPPSST